MLKGSFPALITPLHNNQVDTDALIALLHKHLDAKTDGLVLCGSTGEGMLLSKEERLHIFHTAKSIVGHKIPLVVGCSHFNYNHLLELIDPSYETILVTPPPYIKPSQEGIIAFYERLLQDTQANIILYNIPGRCCVNMEVETIKILFKHPRIIGLKDSNVDLSRIEALASYNKSKGLFCGEDSALLDYVKKGGNGCISVVGNLAPKLMKDFFETHDFEKLNAYIELLNQGGNPSMVKGLMSLRHECHNELRFPLMPIKDSVLAQLKGPLDDLQGDCNKQACQV
ncbi:MAG: dihydrodipicolinate synthase family protein [Alphaproteobacteria bacterium]|nr:MAG: dihydrodipicolinate synthase family protein [Alphaproteobacteria bacterium]